MVPISSLLATSCPQLSSSNKDTSSTGIASGLTNLLLHPNRPEIVDLSASTTAPSTESRTSSVSTLVGHPQTARLMSPVSARNGGVPEYILSAPGSIALPPTPASLVTSLHQHPQSHPQHPHQLQMQIARLHRFAGLSYHQAVATAVAACSGLLNGVPAPPHGTSPPSNGGGPPKSGQAHHQLMASPAVTSAGHLLSYLYARQQQQQQQLHHDPRSMSGTVSNPAAAAAAAAVALFNHGGSHTGNIGPMMHHDEPKPTHSYIGIIAMAILGSKERKLVLSDIYQWILDHYPYFRRRGPGWRNSIRHNLSLNDCFIKVGRSANGKGHYWAVHPANIEDFERGDFRRRRAQRKVRRAMGLSVPDDDDDSPIPSPQHGSGPPSVVRSTVPTGSSLGHSSDVNVGSIPSMWSPPLPAGLDCIPGCERLPLQTKGPLDAFLGHQPLQYQHNKHRQFVDVDPLQLNQFPVFPVITTTAAESVKVSRGNVGRKRLFDVESLLAPDNVVGKPQPSTLQIDGESGNRLGLGSCSDCAEDEGEIRRAQQLEMQSSASNRNEPFARDLVHMSSPCWSAGCSAVDEDYVQSEDENVTVDDSGESNVKDSEILSKTIFHQSDRRRRRHTSGEEAAEYDPAEIDVKPKTKRFNRTSSPEIMTPSLLTAVSHSRPWAERQSVTFRPIESLSAMNTVKAAADDDDVHSVHAEVQHIVDSQQQQQQQRHQQQQLQAAALMAWMARLHETLVAPAQRYGAMLPHSADSLDAAISTSTEVDEKISTSRLELNEPMPHARNGDTVNSGTDDSPAAIIDRKRVFGDHVQTCATNIAVKPEAAVS